MRALFEQVLDERREEITEAVQALDVAAVAGQSGKPVREGIARIVVSD